MRRLSRRELANACDGVGHGRVALVGAKGQSFGIHELYVADTDEAEELADIGGLQVGCRAGVAPAASGEDVGLLAGQQATGPSAV